jgi:hypothetical protein
MAHFLAATDSRFGIHVGALLSGAARIASARFRDEMPVDGAAWEDLDPRAFEAYRSWRAQLNPTAVELGYDDLGLARSLFAVTRVGAGWVSERLPTRPLLAHYPATRTPPCSRATWIAALLVRDTPQNVHEARTCARLPS